MRVISLYILYVILRKEGTVGGSLDLDYVLVPNESGLISKFDNCIRRVCRFSM